jgi:hypothetical protein
MYCDCVDESRYDSTGSIDASEVSSSGSRDCDFEIIVCIASVSLRTKTRVEYNRKEKKNRGGGIK